MASSQVEIASSSPFGRVLKDQNSRRDHHRCSRESNARAAAFQKNLTELVRDRFHNCISVSTNENSPNQTKKTVAILTENDHKTTHRNLRFLTKTNENHPDGNDQSSVLNPSQSRILDRWAAKQAREMVSSIEKQSQEAELLGSLSSSSTSSAASKASPDESGNSNVNLGASSLVQIWEARLNINGMNNNNNMNQVVSRTSSGLSNVENVASTSSPRVETSRGSEMGDSVDERPESVHGNPENSFQDWETQSDRTARSSDAGESERDRVRIADIIKRLTSGSDDHEHELGSNVCESPSRERRHALVLEPVEQREQQQPQQRGGLTQLVSSPKIRGRQAFADLLMQMERDRHRELNSLAERQAVSKFSQRGRIQSMLRLKFMQRGMALRDLVRPQSAGSPSNRVSIGSSIMQLREKFGTGIENGITTQISTATSKNSRMEMANTRANQDEASTSNRLCEDNPVQEVLVAQKSSENRGVEEQMGNQVKDPPPRTDDAEQEKISKNTLLDSQETAEAASNVCDVNEMGEDQEDTNSHQQENSETRAILYERIENEMASEELEASVLDDQNENETAYEQEVTQASDQLFLHPQETAETATFMNNWYENELAEEEEGAYDEHQFFEYNNDWITEISRPRSHWESIRQAWYEERLRSSTDNDEIRQLIERKRVSTFLSSDFRNTMDRLMASRAMGQADMDEYYNEDEESQERTSQLLLAHLQRHLQPETTSQEEEQTQERDEAVQVDQAVEEEPQGDEYHDQEEEEEGEEDDDDDEDDDHYQEEEEEDEEREEERSSISRPFHEASEYFQSSSTIQMPSPSMITSWSFRDNEVVDDSEPVAPPSPQPFPSQSSLQDSRRSHDSTNRLSIEMELIYDLRGQMEQLHREMAELRKSLQSSVDIQAKMQHSNQQQVHSGKVMAHTPAAVAPTKRSCCICYEMQVDSLLYRCGHMCTCLKCAHELQWSSGKCPICRAPIDDVVRAYMDA